MGVSLKVTVLTMPPFSPAKGWCFFNRGKYDAFKLLVEKVKGIVRVNACIEYKAHGNHTFLNISQLLNITKSERNELLLSVKNLQELGSNPFP